MLRVVQSFAVIFMLCPCQPAARYDQNGKGDLVHVHVIEGLDCRTVEVLKDYCRIMAPIDVHSQTNDVVLTTTPEGCIPSSNQHA